MLFIDRCSERERRLDLLGGCYYCLLSSEVVVVVVGFSGVLYCTRRIGWGSETFAAASEQTRGSGVSLSLKVTSLQHHLTIIVYNHIQKKTSCSQSGQFASISILSC